jgi:hypothetical protein
MKEEEEEEEEEEVGRIVLKCNMGKWVAKVRERWMKLRGYGTNGFQVLGSFVR